MTYTQSLVTLIATFIAAIIVVVSHYRRHTFMEKVKDLQRKVEIYESLTVPEFAAMQESAATVIDVEIKSDQLASIDEDDMTFEELIAENLTKERIYQICGKHYAEGLLEPEQTELIEMFDTQFKDISNQIEEEKQYFSGKDLPELYETWKLLDNTAYLKVQEILVTNKVIYLKGESKFRTREYARFVHTKQQQKKLEAVNKGARI
ncbi:MAG TPA: hypothetical protein VK190_03370 [Pseudoneobacillus sp.]|jgi:hypothetical protein|nr:hypothetical protein [Pseudoneobacillus sp.]